jgi:hypothetical protein
MHVLTLDLAAGPYHSSRMEYIGCLRQGVGFEFLYPKTLIEAYTIPLSHPWITGRYIRSFLQTIKKDSNTVSKVPSK